MPDWRALIGEARDSDREPTRAATFIKRFGTASQPVLVQCEDGSEYVVKGKQAGRMIVTDQIVGRIGRVVGAPVAETALVELPEELVGNETEMSHMTAGIAHGSRWIPGCSDRMAYEHCAPNRDRFARLAILYGWVVASDQQFIYENDEPRRVHSVDHGHFFAGSTGWTTDTLHSAGPAEPDAAVVAGCGLSDDELDAARAAMGVPSDEDIAEAVSWPEDDWGVTMEERVAVAEYLILRRNVIFGVHVQEDGDA